ncbi:MAG: hypothetical protein ACXWC9_01450 [Pseudobdellovibrionaceae bacterium]
MQKHILKTLLILSCMTIAPVSFAQNSASETMPGESGTPRGNAANTGITNEELRNSEETGEDQVSGSPDRQTGSMTQAEQNRKRRVKRTGAEMEPSPSSANSRPRSKSSDPSFQNETQKSNVNNPATRP